MELSLDEENSDRTEMIVNDKFIFDSWMIKYESFRVQLVTTILNLLNQAECRMK